jgi:hypothetical protein
MVRLARERHLRATTRRSCVVLAQRIALRAAPRRPDTSAQKCCLTRLQMRIRVSAGPFLASPMMCSAYHSPSTGYFEHQFVTVPRGPQCRGNELTGKVCGRALDSSLRCEPTHDTSRCAGSPRSAAATSTAAGQSQRLQPSPAQPIPTGRASTQRLSWAWAEERTRSSCPSRLREFFK